MKINRMLVADDEEPARMLIAAILAMNGYEVMQASDGLEALHIAREQDFDLVISDVDMPKMTGPELIRAMRQFGLRTKCLLISGYSRQGIRCSPQQEPTRLLAKPFPVEHLLRTVEELLAADRDEEAVTGRERRSLCPAGSQGYGFFPKAN